MRKILLTTMVAVWGLMTLNAQTIEKRNCPAEEILAEQNKNPKILAKRAAIEANTQRFIKEGRTLAHRSGTLTIPVIVHVIYNNAQENISDAQIQSQIDVLTEDFRKLNADASSVPTEFAPLAVDSDIEFTLAQITRTSSSRSSWGTNDAMKSPSQGGVAPINPSENLNVWVCNIGGGILGYAQFPGGPASTDGVVISPQYFGSRNLQPAGQNFFLSAPFDKGRTATHEVGHYLNLRHIWGDGNCNADDFVSDTPNAGGPNYGCPSYPSKSCTSNGGATSDMFMNYMDYVDDACMFMFSAGQLVRMDALFEPGGARADLGFIGGGCTLAAPSGLSAGSIGDNSFSVSWSAVSGAASYSVNVDGSVSTVSGTSTTVSGLTAGTSYAVSVRANCASGSGPFSSAITVSTTGSNCKTGASLTLVTDNYGSETSWTLTKDGSTVATGSGYANNTTYNENFDFGAGNYVFTINDSYGDGICCSYGNGSYTITDGSGSGIASGGQFTTSEVATWCLEGSAGDTQAPSAPSSVSATGVTQTAATVSWSASSDNIGVTGYDVSVNGSLAGSTASTSYNLSGLSAGTTYSVSVVAKDAAGNSSAAGTTSFTTQSTGGPSSQTLIGSTFESGLDGWLDGGS
ncbi:MAG: fibronectin type III domain-containing protein, partial [Cyclobacteriaceae bacterium]